MGLHALRKQSTSKSASTKVPSEKIHSLRKIIKKVQKEKKEGSIIVTTNGCFDILHVGHVRYLAYAKSLGDFLVVGVNSDASVRKLKGPDRPIVPETERAEIIAALESVDAVFIFDEETPTSWLKNIAPDFHVKGADRTLSEMPERDVVEEGGGKIVRAKYFENKSTTNVIEKIRNKKVR